MRSSYAYWTTRFLAGLTVLLASGLGMPSSALVQMHGPGTFLPIDVVLGIAGFWVAITAVNPMVRALTADAQFRREWGTAAHSRFANATTPQRVFLLLLAVAEADGRAGQAERDLVRTFLQSRFTDPRQRADLDAWEAGPRPPRDLTELARLLARDLGSGDRATIYSWSCLVAFADGPLRPEEFRALQQIQNGLGLAPHHALFLFEFAQRAGQRQQPGSSAKARAGASAGRAGTDPGTRPSSRSSQRPVSPPPPVSTRERALATLGLLPDASPERIRHRHRELARQFHPDKHRTLGPVAQREATERFVAIQRAYEQLTGN